ncbi:PTS ascorbate transporter subunit IIC [Clostridium hydrogeniformans]|uniref:PTS ascorbate transporter subunit IIC n=1 Tax=Clostridium hydrogeniformans TaxID=349933 RepID=UPI0004819612|nr:PTS ascorbate transporter subunit IIC [Clostridium hydrogeniformans]
MKGISFLVNEIMKQPPLFLGIISLLGLIFQKKSIEDIIKGTGKTIVGVIVLMKGVDIIAAAIEPISKAFNALYGIEEAAGASYMGTTAFIDTYGFSIGIVMLSAFIINIIVARFTRIKNVFLTGHILFWMAVICVSIGVEMNLSGMNLFIFSTIILSLYIIITPALIRPFVKNVTGDDSFTIGHTTLGFSLIGGYVGRFLGNKEKSTENLKLPKSLGFLRETTITTSIVMIIVYLAVGIIVGQGSRVMIFGEGKEVFASFFVYAIIQGFTFGAGLYILLAGVRLMMSEIIPAFKGISDKFIKGAVPALDCPMVFPFAPNAVLIGFIVSMISSVITIVIVSYMGLFKVALIPLTVACFFDIGPAAVFANSEGGVRGVIISSILNGVLLILFAGISIGLLTETIPDFLRAFGGNDFSIWTILFRGIFKIFV